MTSAMDQLTFDPADPAAGQSVLAAGLRTHYLEAGSGEPLITPARLRTWCVGVGELGRSDPGAVAPAARVRTRHPGLRRDREQAG